MPKIKAFEGSLTLSVQDRTDVSTITVDLKGSEVDSEKLGEAIAGIVQRKLEVVAGYGKDRFRDLQAELAEAKAKVASLLAEQKKDDDVAKQIADGLDAAKAAGLMPGGAPAPAKDGELEPIGGVPPKQRPRR